VAAGGAQPFADDVALEGVDQIGQAAFRGDRSGRGPRARGIGQGAPLVGVDRIALAQDQRALDHVAQLAHVALPQMLDERLEHLGREAARLHTSPRRSRKRGVRSVTVLTGRHEGTPRPGATRRRARPRRCPGARYT
jgi:hypothetical protein